MASSDDLFKSAKDHFNRGHYKLAEPLLVQLQTEELTVKPDVPYMLGTIAFDRGQLKKAISYFKKSIEVDPSFTEASVGLSIILNDLGRYDEAKKVFEDAYAMMKQKQRGGNDSHLKEKIAKKHAELGDLYLMNNMMIEATEEFEKALKMTPNDPDYTAKLGECYLKSKKGNAAISSFEKSLEGNYTKNTHFKLVEAYQQSGQKNKALFELDKMQVRSGLSPEIESWRRRLDELDL